MLKKQLVNNSSIRTHPRAELINSIWRLNLSPRLNLVAWKFIGNMPLNGISLDI